MDDSETKYVLMYRLDLIGRRVYVGEGSSTLDSDLARRFTVDQAIELLWNWRMTRSPGMILRDWGLERVQSV